MKINRANATVLRLPLEVIHLTAKNPRRDAAEDPDLPALAASLGPEEAPTLAQLPVVEDLGEGQYRVVGGERRIRAARLAGWQTLECVVRPRLDPLAAHRLRVVENLHRKELHPLDQAIALKLAWYTANARAMGYEAEAATLLDEERTPTATLQALETILLERGFVPSHPLVSWDETLDGLGIALDKERRKKLMQVLGVAPEVQEQVRQVDMTEASLRALAKLPPADQRKLVAEMAEDPDLARKVRRISHAVRAHAYPLEEALAEARGEAAREKPEENAQAESAQAESAGGERDGDPEPGIAYLPDEDDLADLVVQVMDASHAMKAALEQLQTKTTHKPLRTFPSPWGQYASDALTSLRTTLDLFDF